MEQRRMEHKGTVQIGTERLILRSFCEKDAAAVYRNFGSDPKVTEFLRWKAYSSPDDAEDILTEWIGNYKKADFYQWAIVLKDLGEPVGTISAVEMDERINKIQIGYCIGSKWWHQGITSEALGAVIPFFFREVGANRVEALHDPNNPNSGKVMRKCGMKYEGTLRQADWSNKGIVDACVCSLLAEEWEKAIDTMEKNKPESDQRRRGRG